MNITRRGYNKQFRRLPKFQFLPITVSLPISGYNLLLSVGAVFDQGTSSAALEARRRRFRILQSTLHAV